MRPEVVENWVARESYKTARGKFVGIAIGPDSDEGIVEVNGISLQAGRVLPLPSDDNGYTIKRRTGVKSTNIDGSGLTQLLAVRRLELLLFEDVNELSTEVARTNGRFNTNRSIPLTGDGVLVRMLTIPFVGRRQASFDIMTAVSDVFRYVVYGRRYSRAQRTVVERVLLDASMAMSATVSTVQFNVGGQDVAEAWDELAVEVAGTVANPTAVVDVDAETIGEIGVR